MRIAELLELPALREQNNGCVTAAVIGSGGKTTLLWTLAQHFRADKVLVSTTVKMRPPPGTAYDVFLDEPAFARAIATGKAGKGVTFAVSYVAGTGPGRGWGKMGSLSLDLLASGRRLFDYVFIEADGSRTLPYKGWADYEPVVPEYTDMTIAVMPVPPAGCRVSEESVHRLPLFCAISGASPGDMLQPRHLASAIAHPEGLLARAQGRVVLFFNQAEREDSRDWVTSVTGLLPERCGRGLWKVVMGSALQGMGRSLPLP